MGMAISSARAAMPVVAQPVSVQAPAASAPPAPSADTKVGNVQSLPLAKDGNVGTILNLSVK
jgi:hypothetical protein